MENESSGAGAVFMKREAPDPEQCHFATAALVVICISIQAHVRDIVTATTMQHEQQQCAEVLK